MGAKMQKLQQQFRADAAKSNPFQKSELFAGVSIYVNGLTNPTADELKRIMMTHGGVYDTYHRPGATTFIVAQNLPDVKIRALATSKSKLIISPDWIVDCVREMRILDYSRYLLYTNQRTNQPTIAFERIQDTNIVPTSSSHVEFNQTVFESSPNQIHSQKIAGIESFVAEDEDEDMFADEEGDPDSAEIQTSQSKPIPAGDSELTSILQDLKVLNEQIRNSVCKSEEEPAQRPAIVQASSEVKSTSTKQALTAVDPNFLSEFYNNSRLHHIATLGAGFKSHISALREVSDGSFPGRTQLCRQFGTSATDQPVPASIMHIDMDCFFVSVGLRERPHLRGHPVAVTHSKGGSGRSNSRPGADPEKERAMYEARRQNRHGPMENRMETKTMELAVEASDSLAEIASCSYEARQMGLKNGMFVGAALKLCPNLRTIPYDFEQYKDVAHKLYNTVAK